MKVLFSHWMREIDFDAISNAGIPSIVLMENASRGTAGIIRQQFPAPQRPHVIVAVGPGNNGGDGIATGRILAQWGYIPRFLFLPDPDKVSGDSLINFNIIRNLDLKWEWIKDGSRFREVLEEHPPEKTLIVDAVFGTGLKRPVSGGIYQDVLDLINRSTAPVVSVDIPSGLSDQFPPEAGTSVEPDTTITFQTLKVAHLFPDDRQRCGKIVVTDIGIPSGGVENDRYYIRLSEPELFSDLLVPRKSGVHKGDAGHALVIAGSEEKPGASILSAISVLRSGGGLSTCMVSGSNRDRIMKAYPEIMTLNRDKFETGADLPPGFNCILAGPGMGAGEGTFNLVKKVLSGSTAPVVLDADALNCLGGNAEILQSPRGYPLILTPHPGEFSRLSGLEISEILAEPVRHARDFAMKNGVFLVLKGHYTLLVSPKGQVIVNQTGNPGMATAGSGDVLAGIIAGMTAQFSGKYDLIKILAASLFIHGFAGDIAAGEKGETPLIASDIVGNISAAFGRIHEFKSEFRFA